MFETFADSAVDRLARLEEEYGTPLFERTPRGIRPTAFAHELQRHARRVLADIERSHGVARRMRAGKHGMIAVGAGPVFIPAINGIVGSMIADGTPFLTTHWIIAAAPGIAVVITGFALSLIGDGLADLLRVS